MIPFKLLSCVKQKAPVEQSHILSANGSRYGVNTYGYQEPDATYPSGLGSIQGKYFLDTTNGYIYRVKLLNYIFFAGDYRITAAFVRDSGVEDNGNLPEFSLRLHLPILNRTFDFSSAYSGATTTRGQPSYNVGWYITQSEYNTLVSKVWQTVKFNLIQ